VKRWMRHRLSLGAVLSVTGVVICSAAMAGPQADGVENSGTVYHGVASTRWDNATRPGSAGCSVPFSGTPIYQTQWAI